MTTSFRPLDPSRPAGTERCDAARNRARVLAAAERLFAERCISEVSMDDIAAEAGVGKGTLYRGFGDRAGLALAVLGERDRAFQEALLRGPPPLGPGAPAPERLAAFLQGLVDVLEANIDLLVVSENATPGARYRTRLYDTYRLHATVLLREIIGAEPGPLADLVLAPLAADLYQHLRRDRGTSPDEIKAMLGELAAWLAAYAR